MMNAPQLEIMVFAGQSVFAERLRVQVRRIAPHFRTALLIGEPGCGKAEVARELHRLSPVADGPFLRCQAEQFAAGAVEAARFGTLLLENFGALRPTLQDNLLSRLHRLDRESRHGGETRLIAANEVDLRGMVAAGRMRQQLYGRIGTLEIRVTPLRERQEDLPAMLAGLNPSAEAIALLQGHPWPGNLRELRDVVRQAMQAARASGSSGGFGVEHLPCLAAAPCARAWKEPAEARLEVVMKRHVADVLERCAGNKLRAAEMLGISRSTLYRMLESSSL